MNNLFAEIKKRGNSEKTYKIFSVSEEIYPLPNNLENPKVYDCNYGLEDDEWFHIPSFSSSKYCINILRRDFSSTEYDQISKNQLEKIKYLVALQNHNDEVYFLFQKINTSQLLKKSWFKVSDTPILEKETPLIIVNNFADAIYSNTEDILYFRKLTSISSIFKGIAELYREATETETEGFLNEEFIELGNDFTSKKVGSANRRRIAMAVETLNSFSSNEKTTIFDYIKDYCSDIPFDEVDKTFTIKNEEDLKHLLWGVEQRYYTTKVGDEKRVANSVSNI